jgi:hypothetical protein
MEGGKPILVLKTIVNQQIFECEKKRNSCFKLSSLMLSYIDVKFEVVASLENHGGKLSKSISIL